MAQPGSTYITEDTFKLTEGFFRFEGLGQQIIKGKQEPVKVYRAIAPSTRRTRFDVSAERGLAPFVGRERELELLLDGLDRSKMGRGQAFSITSEAEVGKSRLLYEFRKLVASEDVTFLEGRCLSYNRGVAYHPVIDILKANFDVHENDGDLEIRKKVKKGLKILGADEVSTLPYLLELLAVKDKGINEIPISSEDRKNRITDAIKRIVPKGSEIRPLIMAFEDLHWIDKSSEDQLKHLLESIPGARVLLIFTYRPEFVHTLGAKSFHSQVNLNRLSNRESLIMVSHLLGTEEFDKSLEEFILEKSEGIPFFIEELIKSLQDLKIIERKDKKYRITKDISKLTIPATIQDVIMARIDTLPEKIKRMLQIVSAAGREFSYDLVKKVTDLPEKENRHRRISLLVKLGVMFLLLFKHREYLNLLFRWEPVAKGLKNPALLGAFYARLGQCDYFIGHFDQAIQTLTKAIQLSEAAENFEELLYANAFLIVSHFDLSNYEQVFSLKEDALRILEQKFDLRWYVFILSFTSRAYASLGRWDEAADTA
ncbi:MAG: AAA family ATPase [Deltaproteobacteria bacterium]|jgi:hypothetical protein|nr:AAA family ATPase [Deltaproteobacteria bacterium]